MTHEPATDAPALPAWATGLWPAPTGDLQAPPGTPERRIAFEPMTAADLPLVHAVETQAYSHPWTLRHFRDSLQAGYPAVMLLGEARPREVQTPARPDGRLLIGYLLAMPGVDEVHLLNITVAPAHQRQGWARFMLDALCLWSRGQGAHTLWLEVRQSNAPARRLYERSGFTAVGVRKGYYPLTALQREDAVVMRRPLLTPGGMGA